MMSATLASPAVLREAIAVTKHHAHTFALATRLLPRDLRDDVYLLYLVCRRLDDLVDEHHHEAARRLAEVRAWAGGGPATGREEQILEGLVERYPRMPKEAIADFCDGQAFDLDPAPIQTEAELDRYAYQVAGTVGRLMVAMLDPLTPEADDSGRALGIAMQRTNILRDIDEDLVNGRVYIPAETQRLTHVRDLARDDRRRLLKVEIAIADDWYDRGLRVVDQIRRGQFAVRAASSMYREILREIERKDRPRAIVPAWRKAVLLLQGLAHV
jgi:phytoene synthase